MKRRQKSVVSAIVCPSYCAKRGMDPIMELASKNNLIVMKMPVRLTGAEYFSQKEGVEKGRYQESPPPPPLLPSSVVSGQEFGGRRRSGRDTTDAMRWLNDEDDPRSRQAKKYYHDIEGYNGAAGLFMREGSR